MRHPQCTKKWIRGIDHLALVFLLLLLRSVRGVPARIRPRDDRSNEVASIMFGDSNNIDEKNEDEKVQDFQGFYDSSSRREQKTFRFRETTPSSTKGKKKEVDPFDCCRICPEMFEGIDVVPDAFSTDSALEIDEHVTRKRRSLDSFLEVSSTPSKDNDGLPKIPLTLEQVISKVPCCPVCLEQFKPPVDVDESAFLELEESTSTSYYTSFLQEKFVVGSSAKAGSGVKYRCCTMCPNDAVPGMGSYDAGSFLELGAGKSGKSGKGGETTGPKGIDMTTGCCNTCPSTMFESTETRYSEPQGGPFGLKPRIKEVSEAFPMQTPAFAGGSLPGTTKKSTGLFFP